MKKRTIIQLLSVLLLVAMVLVGCDQPSKEDPPTDDTTAQTEEVLMNVEKPHEKVEAKLENFFVLNGEPAWRELGTPVRYDGTMVDFSTNDLIVFRNADVDVKNVVTETFTVYNPELEKVVLTVTNNYENGDYDSFDWDHLAVTDENVRYPASVVRVSAVRLDSFGWGDSIDVIKVSRATVTPIDEEIREENPDACVYDIAVSHEFYDVAGREIAKTDSDRVVWDGSYWSQSYAYVFGNTHAVFDPETKEVLRLTNAETGSPIGVFDDESEKYGYFYSMDPLTATTSIEVYSKSTYRQILRHNLNVSLSSNPDIFILEDGDILIQHRVSIPEESNLQPDFVTSTGSKHQIVHQLLDVETGLLKEVELDFVIEELSSNFYLSRREDLGVAITEHVVNFAAVYPFADGMLASREIRVLDNDLSVMFTLEALVPEQSYHGYYTNLLGFTVLESGDYLVDLENVIRPMAIVSASGELRAYLPEGAQVVGDLVLTDTGIFDYDMNLLYSLEEHDCDNAFVLGDKILVAKTDPESFEEGFETAVYEIVYENGALTERDPMIYGTSVFETDSDYFIVYDGKYKLYNTELEHIMTTAEEMRLFRFDENYLVYTNLQGIPLLYTVDVVTASADADVAA